jgi:hypothetical protein
MRPLLLLCLLSCPLRAGGIDGGAVSTQDTDLARRMRRILLEDPGAADGLAFRISRSILGEGLSKSEDEEAALGEIRAWIIENPAEAAFLAVGFGKDDREGNRAFELSLLRDMKRFFDLNPARERGILGRLKAAGKESRRAVGELDLDEDERRALLQRVFEGRDGGAGRVEAKPPDESGRPSQSSSYAGDAIYDRLSAARLSGYSPLVQQMQSEMNRARPPGTPALIETGRIDYPTLRQPLYAIESDLERLEAGFRAERAWLQAQGLGEEGQLTPGRLSDPRVQRDLDIRSAGTFKEPAALARRKAALASLREAASAFAAEAGKARDPSAVTAALLRSLSAKRREAARWIAVAALEETLSRLEPLEGFLGPALIGAIEACPLEEGVRKLYLRRGSELDSRLRQAISETRAALELLRRDSSPRTLAEAGGRVELSRRLSRGLPGEVALYRELPGRLLSVRPCAPGWRGWLEGLVLRWAPGSSWAGRIRASRRGDPKAEARFRRIAAAGFQ